MPKAGDIKYCDVLGGRRNNAAFVYVPSGAYYFGRRHASSSVPIVAISKGFWLQKMPLTVNQFMFLSTQFWTHKPQNLSMTFNSVTEIKTQLLDLDGMNDFRLPTVCEWELAAGSNTHGRYVYAGSNMSGRIGCIELSGKSKMRAEFLDNNYGLSSMSGGSHELTSDLHEVGKVSLFKRNLNSVNLDPAEIKGDQYWIAGGGTLSKLTPYSTQARSTLNCMTFRPIAIDKDDDSHEHLGVRLVWKNP